ncbi:MAG: hypothetical protein AAF604_05830 [Acidobacteriota bacterium]
MSDDERAQGMKSAYELALERMQSAGIEPPREGALSEELRARLAEIRQRAEAKLAELEILHRDRLQKAADPAAREQEEEEFQRERRFIESQRDRQIAEARQG